MRVLVACEESQTVMKAFLALGHDAWSCDLQECSGGMPERHYKGDVFEFIANSEPFDLMVAHPPCTHLAVSGAKHFEKKIADGRQQEGIDLFMQFAATDIPMVCIENPVGIMSSLWRTPDQIIQPYYFGDEFQKTTCLWLVGLPKLIHISKDDLFDTKTHVGRGEMHTCPSGKVIPKWFSLDKSSKARSVTFPGIAQAMATQWGALS